MSNLSFDDTPKREISQPWCQLLVGQRAGSSQAIASWHSLVGTLIVLVSAPLPAFAATRDDVGTRADILTEGASQATSEWGKRGNRRRPPDARGSRSTTANRYNEVSEPTLRARRSV
jgi:hypothetical protein